MDNLELKFEINLQRLCCIRIARIFWEKAEVKVEIENYFKDQDKFNSSDEDVEYDIPFASSALCPDNWYIFSKRVLSFVNDLSLPDKFKRLLRLVTHTLGVRIFQWFIYVSYELSIMNPCRMDFFWTYYGTLDLKRIFKLWYEEKKLEPVQLLTLVRHLCLDEYVFPAWSRYRKTGANQAPYPPDEFEYLFFIWIKHFLEVSIYSFPDNERIQIKAYFEEGRLFSENILDNTRMLNKVMLYDESLSVVYIWTKLSNQQQMENIETLLDYEDSIFDQDLCWDDLKSLAYHTLLKQDVYRAMFYILEMLATSWPWEEHFTSIFNHLLLSFENPINRAKYDYQKHFINLVEKIVDNMMLEFSLYDSADDGYCQIIFHEVWCKLPKELKIWVISGKRWTRNNCKISSIFSKLLKIRDFVSLRLIINYKGFQEGQLPLRDCLMNHMKLLLSNEEREQKVYLVHKFVNTIGIDENDRIKLTEYFHK